MEEIKLIPVGKTPINGINLELCSRCGETHKINARPFTNDQIVGDSEKPDYVFTHWSMCPVLNEPVFFNISESVIKALLLNKDEDIIIDERKDQSEIKKKENN